MSINIRINLIANYASQIYVTCVGIIVLPMYLKYLGVEAYGLIGFYSMLQAWFQLLDIGLSPTMSRETSRFNGSDNNAITLRHLLRVMEMIFITTGAAGAILLIAASSFIVENWLKIQSLSQSSVVESLCIIAAIIALRWISGLYRSAVTGFESFVWLGYFNVIIATVRFVLVLPVFIYINADITTYFYYQLCVGVFELSILIIKTYRLLPRLPGVSFSPFDWSPLNKILKFSLSIAFTGSIWILVTQIDKLLLSKLLTLKEYGYFTIAVLVANGITLIAAPFSAVLLTRMSKLASQNNDNEMIVLYRNASQIIACIVVPVALILACFSEQILWAWTGSKEITAEASPVLAIYALGNAVLALAAFAYYLQFAKGDMKLHLIGNGLFIIILLPAIIKGSTEYGMIGAAYAWLISNTLYFVFWVPKVHKKFLNNFHLNWLRNDIAPAILFSSLITLLVSQNTYWSSDRLILSIELIFVAFLVLAVTMVMGSSFIRSIFMKKLSKKI